MTSRDTYRWFRKGSQYVVAAPRLQFALWLAFLVAAAVAGLVVGLWGAVVLLLAAQVLPWRRKQRKGKHEAAPPHRSTQRR